MIEIILLVAVVVMAVVCAYLAMRGFRDTPEEKRILDLAALNRTRPLPREWGEK